MQNNIEWLMKTLASLSGWAFSHKWKKHQVWKVFDKKSLCLPAVIQLLGYFCCTCLHTSGNIQFWLVVVYEKTYLYMILTQKVHFMDWI